MKITCDRAALSEALSAVAGVVATRTPKPILQCVRLSAAGEKVILLGTDLEVGIRYVLGEVSIAEPGEVLVPADRVAAIVRESADQTLELESADHGCRVRGQDSEFRVFGQDPREFPPVGELEGQADLTVKAGTLGELIERTLFAAARENTRYAINGVLWQKRAKKLQLVATDGRRLAWTSGPLEQSQGQDGDVIVPTRAMTLIKRMLSEPDELVRVKLLANQILVAGARATISSVLVEGRFPKYEDVIPRESDKKVCFETARLLSAVRRAALLTTAESKGIRLAFGDGQVVFSSRAPEAGEAEVRMQIDYSGQPLEIGFNPAYLIEALRVAGSETVSFELTEPSKPGLLRAGPNFLYVVMPVSLA